MGMRRFIFFDEAIEDVLGNFEQIPSFFRLELFFFPEGVNFLPV